jgi:DTW domain-containing protein YfiP
MAATVYKPGDIVPDSGIYRIFHDSHRLMHEATLLRGTRFPRCKHCKDKVEFCLEKAIKDDRFIPHFRSTAILEQYEDYEDTEADAAASM